MLDYKNQGTCMLHIMAYFLIAFGVGALLVVDRLGVGGRMRDRKQQRR
jgi:hypothetical protein